MNGFRLVLAAASFGAVATVASLSHAFHEGGVGYCEGCHDLHGTGGGSSSTLLAGADVSSTCLRCHGDDTQPSSVLSARGRLYTPGGDFYWLKRSYSWSDRGQEHFSPGERHGHNVVVSELGLTPDGTLVVAPGGDYPAAALSCISCHDPHGKTSGGGGAIAVSGSYGQTAPEGTISGNYRLLGGVGYGDGAGTAFTRDVPVARAPSDWIETDRNHTVYGSGMSEWCANCHGAFLEAAESGKKHPAGNTAKLGAVVASNYNAYLRTGDMGGSRGTAYLALVPFETGAGDPSALDPSSTEGPEAGTSNVMCLTCHRAHASAFTSAGRWDFKATFLAESHPGADDGGSDALHSYYGRDLVAEFGPYQRSLCNKCHVKD